MSQVTGMVPGMKKEEEVPDVAPQEEQYQEYTVSNGFMLSQSSIPLNISLKLIGKLFNTSMTLSEFAIPNAVSSGYFCQIRFCFLVVSKT